MAIRYGKKQRRQNNIFYTIVAVVLLCFVFVTMVSFFYHTAEDEAYETLHIQTKQIKDDIELQLISDRENLATMANFAAKLYSDGESFDLMFDSFKPIGLIGNIGILLPDNTFVTKKGTINLDGLISFEEEKARGEYISGRVKDLTQDDYDIIRSAVPINVGDRTVGVLYGVIKLDTIAEKYNKMAQELDAQLFLYEESTGDLVIDTVRDEPGNISFLREREYSEGFSYDRMIEEPNGYTSFKSAYTGEQLYVHFSSISEFGWKIILARYESQVFSKVHTISNVLFASFVIMLLVIILYVAILFRNERQRSYIATSASGIRKLLLEINQQKSNITDALREICIFSGSYTAFFFDADGETYNYTHKSLPAEFISGDDANYFISVLLRYAAEIHKINKSTVSLVRIISNSHLLRTNQEFYKFVRLHGISEISFATVIDKNNHINILGVTDSRKSKIAGQLLEDIVVCFSIAIFNKKHLNQTELAATTDSLTGASNRVAYKKDILLFDEIKPDDFSCIYIDVNELHIRNNKYGHCAGDEMLMYISNTLKEVFYGHNIYRMGGDEFLVFTCNTSQDEIKNSIAMLNK